MTDEVDGLRLERRTEPHGRIRMALVDETSGVQLDACALTIDPLELHDGAGGLVRVDGIGNVATLQSHRRRGLASALLRLAIEQMRSGDAAASLLYGIDHFYGPLGWRSCGDERWVRLRLDAWRAPVPTQVEVRAATVGDLPDLREQYEHVASSIPGAASRRGTRTWDQFDPTGSVVAVRDGAVTGWAWRGGDLPEVPGAERALPGARVFGELQAIDEDSMLALVHASCELVRADQGVEQLLIGAPDTHPLRRLAHHGALECALVDDVRPHGGPMLLPFDSDGEALLARGDLYQFLPDRF